MSTSNIQLASCANVVSAQADTEIFAATAQIHARAVYNDSTAALYLKYGTGSSPTSYTVQIPAQGYYEFPQPLYAGQVNGYWAAANGDARTTQW